MDRYLLLAAPAAAASVAVAGPLPGIQWQGNNNIVAFVPESPSAFNQDARGQTLSRSGNAVVECGTVTL